MSKLLCWFASFPYVAYMQIETPSLRVWVLVRGIAVIISPLAFTLALFSNGKYIFGSALYVFIVPVVVFCIDGFLISHSYITEKTSRWLLFIRMSIVLISAAIALFAAVISERENLLQKLHAAEDAVIWQSDVVQKIGDRINSINEEIKDNKDKLKLRSVIEVERLDARRLERLECGGMSGIDPKTGIFIKGGGKCGKRAETYRANAEDAEARLVILDEIAAENRVLAKQRDKFRTDLNKLFQSKRSPDSMGSLLNSLKNADFGLWIRIVGLILCVMLVESLAFIMSEIRVHPLLQTAIQYSIEIDQARLDLSRECEMAEIARERVAKRSQIADDTASLEVTLIPKDRKSRKKSYTHRMK